MPSLVRVLEVGGTHVTAAAVDVDAHRVHERTRTALDSAASAASILASLHGAAMSLADTVPSRWAVAMPDPFDYARGVGLFRDVGKFDALYGVDVGRALIEAITPRPRSITFAHDTEAFLVGEWLTGAARGARRCAALTLGTGVGSAFLDRGTTVRAGAGLPPGGRVHRLSIDGAPLEDTMSRRAIRARYAARAGRPDDLDVREIAELARRGDPAACAVLDDAFCRLGRAFAPTMREFEPDALVIGGSIAGSWDLLIGPLAAGLRDGGVRDMDIRAAEHEADSAVIGAARLAVMPSTERTAARTAAQSAARSGATREVIARELARADVVDRLAGYYADDSDACGANFLDGTEAHPSASVTAADLFAVTTLGLSVPAPVARTLLRDTPAYAEIGRCLAPERLPVDVPLDEATPEVVAAMCELHDAVLAATDGDLALAGALCARKRPELFPVLDSRVRAALQLPSGSVQSCWRVLRSVLRDAHLRTELEWVFGAVRRRGLPTDVYPLRQICALMDVPAVCS
jgi:glucokinase